MRLRRPAGADFCDRVRFGSVNLVPSGNSINRLKTCGFPDFAGRPSITNLVPTGNRLGSLLALYAMVPSKRAIRTMQPPVSDHFARFAYAACGNNVYAL